MKRMLYVSFALVPVIAFADWEAKIQMDGKLKGSATVVNGVMRVKGKKMRLDLKSPMDLSFIGDNGTRKAWMLMHAGKLLMETNFADANLDKIPVCDPKDMEACFTKAGYKKTGREKANGYSCTTYEGNIKPGNSKVPTRVKLWRVDGMKEMPITRVHSFEYGTNKPATLVDLTEIKIAPLAEAIFVPPKNYQNMPNAQGLLNGLLK